nr:MAG TPA: hypothetical protein [Caudoviricetes sp.]
MTKTMILSGQVHKLTPERWYVRGRQPLKKG